MIANNLTDINREIRLNITKPVYLLYGDVDYIKDKYLARLIKQLLPNGANIFNHFKVDDRPLNLLTVENLIYQTSFMGNIVVVLNDLDIAQQSDKEIDKLVMLMSEVSSGVILVIMVRQDNFDVKKSARAKKILAGADKYGSVFELNLGKNGLVDFIKGRVEKSGCTIDTAVIQEIMHWCTDDIDVVLSEVEKLCAFAVSGAIASAMIWEICSIGIEGNVYQISKKMIAHDVAGVMKEIDALLYNKVDPVRIVTTLGYTFTDMQRVKSGVLLGKNAAQIAKDFKMRNESIVGYIMKDVKRLEIGRLEKSCKRILDAEYKLKNASYNSRVLLEQLVLEVMREMAGVNA